MLIGQFTYTACQTPGPYSATPGWKVKQARAELAGVELPAAAVQAAVRPFGVFAAPAVPALATQLEIDQLPRCLRLDLLDGQFRSVAHLAAAGRDHSGRDAFFAHGLLVELTDGVPLPLGTAVDGRFDGSFEGPDEAPWGTLRPADLWGADGWLTPYRAEAIESAVVGTAPHPSDASPLNPERREDFVDLHPGQREFVLAAAQRALTAGTVLVIVGMPVEAAMWISQITHLLLPTAGWSVTFSTYEAGAHPDILRTGSPTIVGIPADAGPAWRQVPGDQAVVHDPAVPQPRESAGYRLADGSLLPVDGWAALAEAICEAGWEDQVRAQMDSLGRRVGTNLDRWPLFGLPAAVLSLPADKLQDRPRVAELAARVAMEQLPAGYQNAPGVLGELVETALQWSPDSSAASQRMLASMDGGADVTGAVIDRLLDSYLRRVLGEPAVAGFAAPWLPEQLRLTTAVGDHLLADLDGLISWIDEADPMVTVRVVLTAAELARRMGWLAGPARRTVERVVSDRARATVVPALLGGAGRVEAASWPAIPQWLWNEVLLDVLQPALADHPPGSVLADPDMQRIVDAAAGPLPTSYVQGETLSSLTAVDGERAAVLLAPGTAPPALPGSEQDEILRSAAFLRTVVGAHGELLVPADQLRGAMLQWFPQVPPRSVVLADLIEQLRLSVPLPDLCRLAAAALDALPPDLRTASIVHELRVAGAPLNVLVNSSAYWHLQFAQRVPATSRDVSLPTMPLARPDIPESRLLQAFADGRMLPPLAIPVRQRLARWILVLAAQALDLPGNSGREQFGWLQTARREPLFSQLEPLYPVAARTLIKELTAPKRPPLAADILAAEWVVRARMAEAGVGGDPASLFFQDRAGAAERGGSERAEWAECVRALVRSDSRGREDLAGFVHRVKVCAEDVCRVAQLPVVPENRRQALIDAAVESATRFTSTGGIARIWRSPVRRDGG